MKKTILLLLFAIICFADKVGAQEYIWPIKDAKAGENILYKPQDYIGDEHNFSDLFIEAPLGSVVVAPVDGVVINVGIGYLQTLRSSCGWWLNEELKAFDDNLEFIREENKNSSEFNLTYITGDISIHTGRNIIYIKGLTGSEVRVGQKIKKGTPIGRVGYAYHKIPKPAIRISVAKNSMPADPMTPFGLKSTYIPPKEAKVVKRLPKEEVKEDFMIYINSLKELFVGLYDVITPQELEQYVDATLKKIDSYDKYLEFNEFYDIYKSALRRINDSHIANHGFGWKRKPFTQKYEPVIHMGVINDTLMCTLASNGYEKYVKQPIVSANGLDADSIKNILNDTYDYDANVQGYSEEYGGLGLNYTEFFRKTDTFGKFPLDVEFASGERLKVDGIELKDDNYKILLSDNLNYYRYRNYLFDYKELNDSTAYLDLRTFGLNGFDLEKIAKLIDSASNKKNFILDIRNNPGGNKESVNKMFSYFIQKPLNVSGYEQVNSRGEYKSFKHSLNYTEETVLFPEYKKIEGKDGFYKESEYQNIEPDIATNYKNKLYVLTNENTVSAGVLFAAMVVKSNQGVIVGREARGAYHTMNAEKFAQIRLPNSTFVVRVPLIKFVFDDVVSERTPYGRGIIPDYYVPFTHDEMTMKNGDIILNYTLDLIAEDKYIESGRFGNGDESDKDNMLVIAVGGISVLLLIVIVSICIFRKRNKRA